MEHVRKIQLELQKYHENNLTKDVIIPILKKMEYHKVEFFGGQSEEGKDIVIWDKDKFGDIKLYVAQVKHFKFTNKASDKNSIQTIVNQLIVCFTKKLPYMDMTSHYPSEVFLISTYDIDTKTLLTRFDTEPNLKDQKIKIIDGVKLASLVVKYLPDFVEDCLGLHYKISSKIKPKFNNDVLLKALGRRAIKDIKTIYSDIDFSLGKRTTNLFFNSSFSPNIDSIELTNDEWNTFKQLSIKLKNEFLLEFFGEYFEANEKSNASTINELNKIEENIKALTNRINLYKESQDLLHKERNSQAKNVNDIESNIETLKNQIKIWSDKSQKHNITDKINTKNSLKELEKQLALENKRLHEIKSKIDNLEKSIFQSNTELNNYKSVKTKLKFKVQLEGTELASVLMAKRNWIEKGVNDYNKTAPTSSELKAFIIKCDKILSLVALIFKSENLKFFGCLGINPSKKDNIDFESTRFKLSIDHIFDTGLNISVLGDAGAGKSTSLEMYAWNRKDSDNIIILLPLGNLFQTNSALNHFTDISEVENLEFLLLTYLQRLEVGINLSEFQLMLKNEKVILLLDGLDEAIKITPLLSENIKLLSDKYPKIQIILSSRMHESYVDKIPFFNVTLLPFTIEQRDIFIKKWFEKEPDSEYITSSISRHLKENKSISEIVRNPLLTTTLCVLAEHKLALPRTEIKLYDERLRLFTGYYDNVKHIVTRITSTPNTLETLAQKLAYILHFQNKREEELSIIKEKALRLFSNQIDENSIITAINELIYPCEILVPMSSDGKYGFGHLRYQEHLAARELLKRNIDIIPLLSQDWWQSPVLLFARMNENLEWLIKLIGEKGNLRLSIINKIIETRHKEERKQLKSLIDKYLFLETSNHNEFIYNDIPSDGLEEEDF